MHALLQLPQQSVHHAGFFPTVTCDIFQNLVLGPIFLFCSDNIVATKSKHGLLCFEPAELVELLEYNTVFVNVWWSSNRHVGHVKCHTL